MTDDGRRAGCPQCGDAIKFPGDHQISTSVGSTVFACALQLGPRERQAIDQTQAYKDQMCEYEGTPHPEMQAILRDLIPIADVWGIESLPLRAHSDFLDRGLGWFEPKDRDDAYELLVLDRSRFTVDKITDRALGTGWPEWSVVRSPELKYGETTIEKEDD